MINSRRHLFSATPNRLSRKEHHDSRYTFSRGYGVNLQSSLTRVLSSALGSSPRLRVSVYGTGAIDIISKLFSRAGINHFRALRPSSSRLRVAASGFAWMPSYTLKPPSSRWLTCPTLSLRYIIYQQRYRTINLLSIVYSLGPRLRTRLTLGGLTFPRKP